MEADSRFTLPTSTMTMTTPSKPDELPLASSPTRASADQNESINNFSQIGNSINITSTNHHHKLSTSDFLSINSPPSSSSSPPLSSLSLPPLLQLTPTVPQLPQLPVKHYGQHVKNSSSSDARERLSNFTMPPNDSDRISNGSPSSASSSSVTKGITLRNHSYLPTDNWQSTLMENRSVHHQRDFLATLPAQQYQSHSSYKDIDLSFDRAHKTSISRIISSPPPPILSQPSIYDNQSGSLQPSLYSQSIPQTHQQQRFANIQQPNHFRPHHRQSQNQQQQLSYSKFTDIGDNAVYNELQNLKLQDNQQTSLPYHYTDKHSKSNSGSFYSPLLDNGSTTSIPDSATLSSMGLSNLAPTNIYDQCCTLLDRVIFLANEAKASVVNNSSVAIEIQLTELRRNLAHIDNLVAAQSSSNVRHQQQPHGLRQEQVINQMPRQSKVSASHSSFSQKYFEPSPDPVSIIDSLKRDLPPSPTAMATTQSPPQKLSRVESTNQNNNSSSLNRTMAGRTSSFQQGTMDYPVPQYERRATICYHGNHEGSLSDWNLPEQSVTAGYIGSSVGPQVAQSQERPMTAHEALSHGQISGLLIPRGIPGKHQRQRSRSFSHMSEMSARPMIPLPHPRLAEGRRRTSTDPSSTPAAQLQLKTLPYQSPPRSHRSTPVAPSATSTASSPFYFHVPSSLNDDSTMMSGTGVSSPRPRRPTTGNSTIGGPVPSGDDMDNGSYTLDLPAELEAQVQACLFNFMHDVCSDLNAKDPKGELIHQALMAKKMAKLDELEDWRPFKFRISAFTNGFLEKLAEGGIPERIISAKKVKEFLWMTPYISRFNSDGRKSKSRGNHVWAVEARRTKTNDRWEFKAKEPRIVALKDSVAYEGSLWSLALRIWDPHRQSSAIKPKYSAIDALPKWMHWDGPQLTGLPRSSDLGTYELNIAADYEYAGRHYHLTQKLNVRVTYSSFSPQAQPTTAAPSDLHIHK